MTLFEVLYYAGYRVSTARDLRRLRRLPARVISVGNITSGGTGKTPLTIALASEALRRGLRPIILTRGYKGKARGPCIVRGHMSASEVGDEPLLMAEKLAEVPVVKCADRYEAGMFALEHLGPFGGEAGGAVFGGAAAAAQPLFILDDGFQHRRLYRDRDILLVDAQNPFDNRRLLPMGLLREPLREMSRAAIIVITKGMGSDCRSLREEIRRHNPRAPIFVSGHRPSHIWSSTGQTFPAGWLSGREVCAFCGIADPDSFRVALGGAGAVVKEFRAYGDHYSFRPHDLQHMVEAASASGAEWIITTEKDIMRLKSFRLPENLVALGIELVVDRGFYDEAFKSLTPEEETGRDGQVH
jgi:tetraacyldisaccharide 4'-kinase